MSYGKRKYFFFTTLKTAARRGEKERIERKKEITEGKRREKNEVK